MNPIEIDGVRLELSHIPGRSEHSPLVFLHEGLGSVAMWQQKGRHWPSELCAATGRAGWLYSRRGYGQSDPIPDVRAEPENTNGAWSGHRGRHRPDYMHQEAWRVLPALLKQIGVANPVLIGHSDGASIALLHASRFPVAACVVMAPHLFVEDIAIRAITQAKALYLADAEAPASSPPGLRRRLSRFHADVDNAFWQWNDIWLSEAFRRFNIEAECRAIQAPLLAVQGLADEYGTLAQLDALEHAVPHVQRVQLADCGHSPHRDQPQALTDAVAQLLNKVR